MEDPTTSSQLIVRFGVGCFHFSYIRRAPYSATIADYVSAVTAALERVGAIGNVEVESYEPQEQFSVPAGFRVPRLAEGDNDYFPGPSFFFAKFDLFIPARIQEELVEGSSAETRTENFRVFVTMTFHGPTTFIQLLDPDETDIPRASTAVRVVREYLNREIQQGDISFDCLGPSPFHADFSLSMQTSNSLTTRFVVERRVQVGYDEILIRANSMFFGSIEAAFYDFRDDVEEEFGFFYDVVRRGHAQFRRWMNIVDNLEELTRSQPQGNAAQHSSRLRLGQGLQELMTQVVTFEADAVIEKTMIGRDYRSVYGPNCLNVVRADVDEELKQVPEFATKPVLKLITFLENRRVVKIGWLVAIAAGLIGGIAGASLTSLPAASQLFRRAGFDHVAPESTRQSRLPLKGAVQESPDAVTSPEPLLRLEISPSKN